MVLYSQMNEVSYETIIYILQLFIYLPPMSNMVTYVL